MNKPSWDDAPKWANYLARDQVGRWYWYANEPDAREEEWFPSGAQFKLAFAPVFPEWTASLEMRPKPIISINWDAVPEEWNYFAFDSDGHGYFYENKPEVDGYDDWRVPSESGEYNCVRLDVILDTTKTLLKRPK